MVKTATNFSWQTIVSVEHFLHVWYILTADTLSQKHSIIVLYAAKTTSTAELNGKTTILQKMQCGETDTCASTLLTTACMKKQVADPRNNQIRPISFRSNQRSNYW